MPKSIFIFVKLFPSFLHNLVLIRSQLEIFFFSIYLVIVDKGCWQKLWWKLLVNETKTTFKYQCKICKLSTLIISIKHFMEVTLWKQVKLTSKINTGNITAFHKYCKHANNFFPFSTSEWMRRSHTYAIAVMWTLTPWIHVH